MFEHGVDDVDAASDEADECGVVLLALGPFAVVVGPAGGVVECGEGSEEEGSFELLVAVAAGVFAADARARSSSDGCQSGVGGEVTAGGEGRALVGKEEPSPTSRRMRAPVLTPMPGIEVRQVRATVSRLAERRPGNRLLP